MVIVATVAAIIASQAVISGAFSVTPPGGAARLPAAPDGAAHEPGDRPGLRAGRQLGHLHRGRALVLGFGTSERLAAAYGIAVTGTLAIDTLLFFFVVRALWHKPLWLVVAGARLPHVDLAFFGANLPKVLHGGWFPL
jgi:KUP system potassium uptake protein